VSQHCDSTCSWCAREFWRWLKDYQSKRRARTGRDGKVYADFVAASATSIKPEDKP